MRTSVRMQYGRQSGSCRCSDRVTRLVDLSCIGVLPHSGINPTLRSPSDPGVVAFEMAWSAGRTDDYTQIHRFLLGYLRARRMRSGDDRPGEGRSRQARRAKPATLIEPASP